MKPKSSLAVAALACLLAVTARASSFTLNLDRVFPSFQAAAPSSLVQPWLTATFTDNGTDDVLLTMTALNLTTNTARPTAHINPVDTAVPRRENVVDWWFNINPSLSAGAAKLSIAFSVGVGASINQSVDDGIHPGSDGFYDFAFVFAPSTFTDGLSSVYELKGLGQVIHASDFVGFFSSPDNKGIGVQNGTYESAANIQDTMRNNAKGPIFDNAVIGAVPEPATWLLVGSMFVLPVLIRFSRRRKQ
jgi:hypothetical protein